LAPFRFRKKISSILNTQYGSLKILGEVVKELVVDQNHHICGSFVILALLEFLGNCSTECWIMFWKWFLPFHTWTTITEQVPFLIIMSPNVEHCVVTTG
jgi:hypothetical protein